MHYESWVCLMVEKGPGTIDDEVHKAIKIASCELYLHGRDRMHISSKVCTGIIQTEWDTYSVGARSGVLFRAQIDTENAGGYRVNFLLSTADLERGADTIRRFEEREGRWREAHEPFPVDALNDFTDLNAPRHRTVH